MRYRALLILLACSWFGCSGASHVVTAESEPLLAAEIEQFMQILSASSPTLAPDGTTYFITWSTGVYQLHSISAGAEHTAQHTSFDDGIDYYDLSPDGQWAIVGASAGGSEQADIHLLRLADGTLTTVAADPELRYDSVLWERDSTGFYFRSNEGNGTDFFLYHADLDNLAYELVYESLGFNALSDISDDGATLVVNRYQSNADGDIYLYDLSGDEITESLLTAHEGEVQYHVIGLDSDGAIWVVSNRDSESLRIGVLDITSGAVDYRTNDSWEIEEALISSNRQVIAYTTNEDGYGRLQLLNLGTGERTTPPLLDNGVVTLGHFLDSRLAAVFTNPTQTGDVWLVDTEASTATQVTFSDYAGIDPSSFRNPELIRYETFDGKLIPAFLFLPPDYDGGIVPTIIHVHGGPESQFRPYFLRHFQYLMLNGFAVLAPNVRGSSGYGPDYMALDNYTLRRDSVADIGAAVDWLLEQGYTDEEHLGIKGSSYGGYMVMAAITEMPTRFAAAIEEVGIVNFVTFLENTADYRRALREAEYGPLSDIAFLESISPIHRIDQISTPLLVIHGENDSRVPVGEARQIISALEARGHAVEGLIFPDEGHGVRHLENRLVMYRRMVDFFKQHLVGNN